MEKFNSLEFSNILSDHRLLVKAVNIMKKAYRLDGNDMPFILTQNMTKRMLTDDHVKSGGLTNVRFSSDSGDPILLTILNEPDDIELLNSKHIVPMSGGLDSFVLYSLLKHEGLEPLPIYVDLQTPYSEKEKKAVLELAPETLIIKIDMEGLIQNDDKWGYIVPTRNQLIMTTIFAFADVRTSYAKFEDGRFFSQVSIYFGALLGEINDNNPDKSLLFLTETERALQSKSLMTKVLIPFQFMTKTDIVSLYMKKIGNRPELLKTVTCFSGSNERQCGKCKACFRRWVALKNNGLNDNFAFDPYFSQEGTILLKKFNELIFDRDYKRYSRSRMEQTVDAVFSEHARRTFC